MIKACACINVPMGSYANQVEVPIPPHMVDYEASRLAAGLAATICLDRCIAAEVQELWTAGVRTYGCCCGHNKGEPFINVHPGDAGRMKAMGYVVHARPADPSAEDTFTPLRSML